MKEAQERMRFYADRKWTERELEVGDWVYIKLRPYRKVSVALRSNLKLTFQVHGPYNVIKKLSPVAYELQLPATIKIHPVFHISQLKKKIRSYVVPVIEPPVFSTDGKPLAEPIAILERSVIKRNNAFVVQVLLQWENLLPE